MSYEAELEQAKQLELAYVARADVRPTIDAWLKSHNLKTIHELVPYVQEQHRLKTQGRPSVALASLVGLGSLVYAKYGRLLIPLVQLSRLVAVAVAGRQGVIIYKELTHEETAGLPPRR